MKKIVRVLAALMLTSGVYAQTPKAMSYQAVIRDGSSEIVTNQSIAVKVSILENSDTGTVAYTEYHNVTTNSNGLATFKIGEGNSKNGNLATLNWSNNRYYIKTETDLNGGSNYTLSGTSELLSVPYAFYADTSGNGPVGKSAYQIAIDNGYTGTEAEWINSLKATDGTNGIDGTDGTNGKSAYQIALDEGYTGTEEEWLNSLKGKSAYEIAVSNGYTDTEAEWLKEIRSIYGIHIAHHLTNYNQQGLHIGWNRSGSVGEANFVNNKGLGAGGFNFDEVNSGKRYNRLRITSSGGLYINRQYTLPNIKGTTGQVLTHTDNSGTVAWRDIPEIETEINKGLHIKNFSTDTDEQGLHIGWNRSTNQGETNFVNNSGKGATGGFKFTNIAPGEKDKTYFSLDKHGRAEFTANRPGKHVMYIVNENDGDNANGLYIRINKSEVNETNNFVTFYDKEEHVKGRIEGFQADGEFDPTPRNQSGEAILPELDFLTNIAKVNLGTINEGIPVLGNNYINQIIDTPLNNLKNSINGENAKKLFKLFYDEKLEIPNGYNLELANTQLTPVRELFSNATFPFNIILNPMQMAKEVATQILNGQMLGGINVGNGLNNFNSATLGIVNSGAGTIGGSAISAASSAAGDTGESVTSVIDPSGWFRTSGSKKYSLSNNNIIKPANSSSSTIGSTWNSTGLTFTRTNLQHEIGDKLKIPFNLNEIPMVIPSHVNSYLKGELPYFTKAQYWELMKWAHYEGGWDLVGVETPQDVAMFGIQKMAEHIFNDGGVTYGSKGADYAEWIPKENPEENFNIGEIVGVKNGKLSKNTTNVDNVMIVSSRPIVLGNIPEAGKEEEYEKVGFMGQVATLVKGKVNVGDYIIPSGDNDGFAIGIAPENVTAKHIPLIAGKAWSATTNDIYDFVNVAVGLKTSEMANIMQKQEEKVKNLEDRLKALEEAFYVKE